MSHSESRICFCFTINVSKEEYDWFSTMRRASDLTEPTHWNDNGKPISPQSIWWHGLYQERFETGSKCQFHFSDDKIVIWNDNMTGDIVILSHLLREFLNKCRHSSGQILSFSWCKVGYPLRPGSYGGGACIITESSIYFEDCCGRIKRRKELIHMGMKPWKGNDNDKETSK